MRNGDSGAGWMPEIDVSQEAVGGSWRGGSGHTWSCGDTGRPMSAAIGQDDGQRAEEDVAAVPAVAPGTADVCPSCYIRIYGQTDMPSRHDNESTRGRMLGRSSCDRPACLRNLRARRGTCACSRWRRWRRRAVGPYIRRHGAGRILLSPPPPSPGPAKPPAATTPVAAVRPAAASATDGGHGSCRAPVEYVATQLGGAI